jgi:hypothetical protein
VVAALHLIALEPPQGEGKLTVHTRIFQCNGLPGQSAIENQAFAQQDDGAEVPGDLPVPSSNVPAISQEQVQFQVRSPGAAQFIESACPCPLCVGQKLCSNAIGASTLWTSSLALALIRSRLLIV